MSHCSFFLIRLPKQPLNIFVYIYLYLYLYLYYNTPHFMAASLPKVPTFSGQFHVFAQESFEAWVLLGAALVYVCCVYFTGDLIIAIPALRPTTVSLEEPASPSKKKGKMHGIEVEKWEKPRGPRKNGGVMVNKFFFGRKMMICTMV